LDEEELGILTKALIHWRRKFSGRAGYRRAACAIQESAAERVERLEKANGLAPKLGEVYRRPIPGWQAQAEADRRQVELTRAMLERLQEPDNPMVQFISQEALEAIRNGAMGVLSDENGESVGAVVSLEAYRLVKACMAALRGYRGAWGIVKLDAAEEAQHVAEGQA
jgi:hypothetical protein